MNLQMLYPSGGLFYHLRAWRYRRGLWMPFHHHVLRWLTDWRPSAEHLVLLGPSGGYALSSQFLARFGRITVIEPDPLAHLILRRRFPATRFDFATAAIATASGLNDLVERYPQAAFLFCNLLGQELVGAPPDFECQAWLHALESILGNRAWASWHELVSTAQSPARFELVSRPGAEPLEVVCAQFWPGGELELHDHGCTGLCPTQTHQYAIWSLTPHNFHLIEWLCSQVARKPPLG